MCLTILSKGDERVLVVVKESRDGPFKMRYIFINVFRFGDQNRKERSNLQKKKKPKINRKKVTVSMLCQLLTQINKMLFNFLCNNKSYKSFNSHILNLKFEF